MMYCKVFEHAFVPMDNGLYSLTLCRLLNTGMGSANGKDIETDENLGFVLISNKLEKELSFDPDKSVILSFGIDKQINPNYEQKSLGLTVKMDALEVTKAFIDHLHIRSFEVYCSSDDPVSCTRAGIEDAIERTAREVTDEGMFVLYFGGHGVNDGDKKWALAPADFDLSPNTYITSDIINKAIKNSNCQAKHVLVILDCCYSGMMGSDMTNNADCLLSNLYVLAAGSAHESSFAITSLHHSIFSYFLKVALDVIPWKSGIFPLAEVYDFCKDCTAALSSLILTIDNCTVKTKHVVPSLSHFNPDTEATDGDAASSIRQGRLEFLFSLFDRSSPKPRPKLHPATHSWLHSLIRGQYQPIYSIRRRRLFDDDCNKDDDDRLLKTIVSLIMHSVAVLEVFYNRDTAGEPDIFLIGFIQTMAAVDFVLSNCVLGVEYIILSWALYHRVLVQNNIDDGALKELLRKIKDSCSEVSNNYILVMCVIYSQCLLHMIE